MFDYINTDKHTCRAVHLYMIGVEVDHVDRSINAMTRKNINKSLFLFELVLWVIDIPRKKSAKIAPPGKIATVQCIL